jgi:hypothetical protein
MGKHGTEKPLYTDEYTDASVATHPTHVNDLADEPNANDNRRALVSSR